MIDNGNVIKNKLIKIKILNSLSILNRKFVPVAKMIIGIKKGIIRINWINLFLFIWSEIKADRIEIKLRVGKEIIKSKMVSIKNIRVMSKKIEEIGIKNKLGNNKEIDIAKHFARKMEISE